jgi:hypothetical protein
VNAVHLRRVNPARNMRRFFWLDVQPDLFGGVLLVEEWGRIGARAWWPSVTTPRLLPSSPCSSRPSARGGRAMGTFYPSEEKLALSSLAVTA